MFNDVRQGQVGQAMNDRLNGPGLVPSEEIEAKLREHENSKNKQVVVQCLNEGGYAVHNAYGELVFASDSIHTAMEFAQNKLANYIAPRA